ncbi:MAG: exo-alpha-sialidase [Verrucomicrobia bacterium]|nr:exo-alpha-sialidase [Verrucomicrobiota bacterium]
MNLPSFSRIALLATSAMGLAASAALEQTEVFVSGRDGYHTYRIPAVLRAPRGALLAFCEGRKSARGDSGNIDLLVKRSTDGGRTWSPATVVWDDADNTCGNPCPVVDEQTGTIWLLLTHNIGTDPESAIITKQSKGTRTVWVTHSRNEGVTWAPPVEITRTTKDPAWGWYATGPGIGIQIQHGAHAGRLVIPCDHSYDDPQGNVRGGPYEYGSHAVISDDHGKTWRLGGLIRPKVNECQVVESLDTHGTLIMNMRAYFGRNRRAQATSADGGLTWSAPSDVPDLVEPVCQASIVRAGAAGLLLFSNPASTKRERLTVKASTDGGRTWPRQLVVHEGPAAYSSLIVLDATTAGCLYERGDKGAYEKITFARFPLTALQPARAK